MLRTNRYTPVALNIDATRANRYTPILNSSAGSTNVNPVQSTPAPVAQPIIAPVAQPIIAPVAKQSIAQQYGLPESTLSQGKASAPEKQSLWNKVVRAVLPDKVEDFFGMNKTPIQKQIETQGKAAQEYADTRSRGLWGNLTESYSRGNEAAKIDTDMYAAMMSNDENAYNEVNQRKQILQAQEANDPIKNKNLGTETLSTVAGMTPAMLTGNVQGKVLGLGAAALVGIAGNVGPQAATPEEIITMPTAYKAGEMLGGMQYWYRQGAGSMYGVMRDEGIDHNTSKWLSSAAGVPYAAVEFSQIDKIVPGLNKLAQQEVAAVTRRSVASMVKKYGANWATEVGEEGLQQFITGMTTEMGKWMDDKVEGIPVAEALWKVSKQSIQTMIDSALPMLLMTAPSAIAEGAGAYNKKAPMIDSTGEPNIELPGTPGPAGPAGPSSGRQIVEQERTNGAATNEPLSPEQFPTREQFYLSDINRLADKYQNEPAYQAEKGDDRFYARIADDHFNELNPATQDWLAGQAPGVDFESKNVPQYKGFVNADENTSGNDSVHGGQITLLKQAVDNQLMNNELDTSRSVGDLQTEYQANNPVIQDTRPGYQKVSNFIDNMTQSGTLFPESGPILKSILSGFNDRMLERITYEENGNLSGSIGRFNAAINRLQMQQGWDTKPGNDRVGARAFMHEFGHASWWMYLTEDERNMVTQTYKGLKKKEQRAIFEGQSGNANHHAKNEREFFAQSFSDYIFENKVPAAQMEPLLKRISNYLFQALKNLVNRGEIPAIKTLSPIYERILTGGPRNQLGDLASNEPPSFKAEIQRIFDNLAPTASQVATQQEEQKRSLFPTVEDLPKKATKEQLNSLFNKPSKEVPAETLMPQTAESPAGMAEEILQKGEEGLPPDIGSTIEPLEAVIEGQKQTPLNERIRWIDYLRTPWKVFDRMKIRPAYQALLKGYEGYVKELPGNIDKITAWSKRVSREGNQKIFKFLDGEEITLTAEESQVAKEIKAWLGEWADRLGMSPDDRISDYITHIFPFGKGGEIPEEIAFLINKKIPGSVYDPFLLQRQGAKGYIQNTWMALDAYVKRATRKVNMDPGLAELKVASSKLTDVSQLNYLNSYLGAVNMRPTTLDTLIDNHIKEKVGYLFGARPTATITRSIRMMISRAKIGGSITSFAKNLTQGVNTFSELGGWYTTRGYMDLVKFGGKEMNDNGVLIAPFIEDRTYSAVKKMAERFDNVLFLNMNASELVNRGAAYYGAKAKFAAGKITNKEFREALGREKPADYKPTKEDAIAYGKFVSAKTQFLFGSLDTPVALNSDIAKMAAQFQTFGLKQTEFIGHMVGQKEWLKLIRYIVSSMLLFSYIGGAFGMKWDDSFKTLRWGMPPAIQFFVDLYKNGIIGEDKYGNKLDGSQKAKLVGKSLFTNIVPAGAQIQRTIEGLSNVNAGKETTSSGKLKYKVAPTTENYVSGALFGKYNLPESKAYYKKQDDKTKKKTTAPSRAGRYTPQ